MGSFPIYLLFAAIPFWHVRIAGGISLYEITVVVNLLAMPFHLGRGGFRWGWVDTLVFLFALYGILSVAMSSASLYESMRTYRYLVLGPALLYFIVRVMRPNQQQMAKGMAIFSTFVAIQSLAVIYYVITHGERPATGIEWESYQYQGIVAGIVTFSVLAVMAASSTLYLARYAKGIKSLMLLLIGLVCTAGLLASATRASAFGFLLLFPLSGWFLHRAFRRKLLVAVGYVVVFGVGIVVALMFMSGPYVALGNSGEEQRAIERVVDIEEYKADILGRVAFWKVLVAQSSDSILFGKGMASFDIGTSGGTTYHVSSAHNVFVSTYYTSGIIGLVVMLLLWRAVFRGIYKLDSNTKEDSWRTRFLVVSVMVLLLVSVTNDLTAGRGNLLMLLLAFLSYQPVQRKNNNDRKLAK